MTNQTPDIDVEPCPFCGGVAVSPSSLNTGEAHCHDIYYPGWKAVAKVDNWNRRHLKQPLDVGRLTGRISETIARCNYEDYRKEGEPDWEGLSDHVQGHFATQRTDEMAEAILSVVASHIGQQPSSRSDVHYLLSIIHDAEKAVGLDLDPEDWGLIQCIEEDLPRDVGQQPEWRDMDNDAKDGSWWEILYPNDHIVRARYNPRLGCWEHGKCSDQLPTHYRPIAPLPAQPQETARD